MTLKTDSFAVAEVRSTSDLHVALKITETDQPNSASLLKLSAMLAGVAGMLRTGERP